MLAKILWLCGSAIFLVLGTLHLYYTFFTTRFHVRSSVVMEEMKKTSPVLTRDTTMWKAWIGFNASHSVGAIFIGLINILLAAQYFSLLQNSVLIILLNIVTAAFYCWLAKKYWFRVPFIGIATASACFAASSLLICFG